MACALTGHAHPAGSGEPTGGGGGAFGATTEVAAGETGGVAPYGAGYGYG